MNYLLTTVGASVFFSSYQILIKHGGFRWWTAALLVNGGGFLITALVAAIIYTHGSYGSLSEFLFRPDAKPRVGTSFVISGVLLGIFAGTQNGAGHLFYQQLVATSSKNLLVITVTVPVLCIIVGSLVAIMFNGEKLTGNKIATIFAAGVTVWLASRPS